MNNKWSLRKKIILGIILTIVLGGAVIGVVAGVAYSQQNSGGVIVVPVSDVDYGYGGEEASQMEGRITFGNAQNIRVDSSKPVTELLVKKGDKVKKGDVIAKYDSTTAKSNLDQRNLDVTSIQSQIDSAQAKLNLLNTVSARTVPVTTAPSSSSTSSPSVSANGDNEADAPGTDDTRPVPQQQVRMQTEYVDNQGNKYEDMAEVRRAKNEQLATLRELRTNLEEAQQNVEKAKQSVADCDIRATMDGVVTLANSSALQAAGTAPADPAAESGTEGGEEAEAVDDEEDAEDEAAGDDMSDVILSVSGLEGLYVSTFISEWTKASVAVGDTIYVTSMETGGSYEAQVTEISPYVSEQYASMYADYGLNISYYPLTARITGGGDELRAGEIVNVSYHKEQVAEAEAEAEAMESGDADVHYIWKAFILVENGKKYAYIRGKDKKLVKKRLKVDGKAEEIYTVSGGLTDDDYIAFPYSKGVKEGAKTRKGTVDDLYGD